MGDEEWDAGGGNQAAVLSREGLKFFMPSGFNSVMDEGVEEGEGANLDRGDSHVIHLRQPSPVSGANTTIDQGDFFGDSPVVLPHKYDSLEEDVDEFGGSSEDIPSSERVTRKRSRSPLRTAVVRISDEQHYAAPSEENEENEADDELEYSVEGSPTGDKNSSSSTPSAVREWLESLDNIHTTETTV